MMTELEKARKNLAVIEGKLISEGKFPEPIKVRPHASMDELEAYILSEIEKGTEEIDLRSYGVTVSGFGSFYHDMINRHPELFYIRSGNISSR